MFLIADSGSSKTDWRLIKEGKEIKKIETIGFNPYFIGSEEIVKVLKNDLSPYIHGAISEIFFYGAGCSNEKNCTIVKNALRRLYPEANIEVEHDMLAAARALWGNQKGIATIVGTGSNACYYDGEKIAQSNLSLGYILGDEGGGDYMGKKLLRDYLSDEMPPDLIDTFNQRYSLTKLQILHTIYRDPFPNCFFASFSPFISDNILHPFIYNLVYKSFNDFFEKQISKFSIYREVPIGCVGTVGFYLKDILIQVGEIWGTKVTKFLKSPMEGLIEFHIKK